MKEYGVVEENSFSLLQNSVNELLAEGWEVTGGFTSFSLSPKARPDGQIVEERIYCQAMIRSKKEVQEAPQGEQEA